MSIMKDYMDKVMHGVEEINLKPKGKMKRLRYIVLKNIENGRETKLDVKDEVMAAKTLALFDRTFGKLPTDECINDEGTAVAQMNESEILSMIETAENLEVTIALEKLIRELEFLIDCKQP